MASFDDEAGGLEPAPTILADPMDRPVRHTRALRKGNLRLIQGEQILVQSHDEQSSQIWRLRQHKYGEKPESAKFGYLIPMGKAKKSKAEPRPMSAAKAVSAVLKEIVPHRGWSEASDVTGIPDGTLRRLRDGQKTVDADLIIRLRKYPNFSPKFDGLTGEATPGTDHLNVAKRLCRAFEPEDAELIVSQIEYLSESLDTPGILMLLKSQRQMLDLKKPSAAPRRKSPLSAKSP